RFLIKRPLLEAIAGDGPPPLLLIDEIDRADEEFEAYLLELLSDFQITVPELGTFRAAVPPPVIITSNRTREIHDALKRRCLYQWIDYPTVERELAIVARRLPDVPEKLARSVVAVVQALRRDDLFKRPGVAETLDWAMALSALGTGDLDEAAIEGTLGVVGLLPFGPSDGAVDPGARRPGTRSYSKPELSRGRFRPGWWNNGWVIRVALKAAVVVAFVAACSAPTAISSSPPSASATPLTAPASSVPTAKVVLPTAAPAAPQPPSVLVMPNTS